MVGIMNKKLVAVLILCGLCLPSVSMPVFAEPFKGYVEETNKQSQVEDKIFTKEVEKLDETKTVELTVSQVLAGATSVEGDEFFA